MVAAAAEGGALLPSAVRLDKTSGGALTRALKFSRFTGKPGQMLEVLAPSGMKASRLLLVGLGKAEALDEKWLPEHRWVAKLDGQVVGWTAAAPVSTRDCYAGVAETSVYVGDGYRGSASARRCCASR